MKGNLRLFLDFGLISKKERKKNRKLQIHVSHRKIFENIREVVRWKAENPCFYKIKKLQILPQSHLIFGTIEEEWFLRSSKTIQKHRSSMVTEIKGDWGRIRNFLILWKHGFSAFKRAASRTFSIIIQWDTWIWSFQVLFFLRKWTKIQK